MTRGVTPELVILTFALGAAALAVWLAVRFPDVGPTELRGVLLHTICACGVFVAFGGLVHVDASDAAWRRIGTVFVIDLPVLVYMLLVCFWILKVFRGAMTAAR